MGHKIMHQRSYSAQTLSKYIRKESSGENKTLAYNDKKKVHVLQVQFPVEHNSVASIFSENETDYVF